ncbi:hypothetical protein TNCV_5024001 [Trichonephila clavipes]|nr:hypothetical protein TNCV_5024001 [Trichonephila clavipes]
MLIVITVSNCIFTHDSSLPLNDQECADTHGKHCSSHFLTELFTYTNESTQHPEYLRQASLEVIDSISEGAFLTGTKLFYLGGSKNQECTGSGAFVKYETSEISLKRRLTDHCLVFSSKLIVIDEDCH